MSEDSSSDGEWCESSKKPAYSTHPKAKCWECGKQISNLQRLMLHYKSHDIKATCHICGVTFRRLTSLSVHLDNAHSPPICLECHQSFCNVWELNKHAEINCKTSLSFQDSSSLIGERHNVGTFSNTGTVKQSTDSLIPDSASYLKPEQRAEVTPKTLETSENSVEYVLGEDDSMESDCEKDDDSTSTESEDETQSSLSLPHNSSDALKSSDCGTRPAALPSADTVTCTECGQGPFMSMKRHLLQCSSVKNKPECVLCKKRFLTVKELQEHHKPLQCCEMCFQVFPHQSSYCNQCPKGGKSFLVLFCSKSMPKLCKICKSLFICNKTLSAHVRKAHSFVVTSQVIVPLMSKIYHTTSPPGDCSRTVQSAVSAPHVVNQAIDMTLPSPMKSTTSSPSTSSHSGTPPSRTYTLSAAATVDQPSSNLFIPISASPGANVSAAEAGASNADFSSMPTILASFKNVSQSVALKGVKTGWRSKTCCPCRQCGTIFRQPSLIIPHRYHHRGRHSHQCECGRAFKHRLHLLRHCVQHAEAISYICVSCGDTFTGAKHLAQHLRGKSQKKSSSGYVTKTKVKKKCRMPFTCDCGQLFLRPSAYLWHYLKNRKRK
ncbi:zinc finger protein 729 [Cololabis saira]|uniref:zinc finger protein 729 n=1 Tax=Cololabis saira TaxID=129043 RepID=UPI002AD20224|nr:zinc finger protein 729 [Cololabis saira]